MKKSVAERRGYVVGTELFITNDVGTTKVVITSLDEEENKFRWKVLSEIKGEIFSVIEEWKEDWKEEWLTESWAGFFDDERYKIRKVPVRRK